MPRLKRAWGDAAVADLAEARQTSDQLTLSQRADEAAASYVLTLWQLSMKARDDRELDELLAAGEPQPSLRRIWERRRRSAP